MDEKFDDGLTAGWHPYLAGWSESGGTYHGTNGTPNAAVESVWAQGFGWRDYKAEVDVRIQSGYEPADAQLMFRYRSTGYVAGVENNCKCAIHQYGGTSLYLAVPGQPEQWLPYPFAVGQTVRLRATAVGNTVTCEVAGVPGTLLTAVTSGAANGTVALRATHAPADFDNLRVTAIGQRGHIVFRRDGNIWSMLTDGSDQHQLTSGGNDISPRLENDVVTFIRGGWLYRTDLAGSSPQAIPNSYPVLEYDLSPDATKVVLTHAGFSSTFLNDTLWTMNIDGTAKAVLTRNAGQHQIYPSWARNGFVYYGQTIFFNPYVQRLWRIAADGSVPPAQLTNDFTQYPKFGTPSNRVVFVYNQPAPMLRTMDPAGGSELNVIGSPAGIIGQPAPDEELDVLYYNYSGHVFRTALDGSSTATVSTADADHIDYGLAAAQGAADTTPPVIHSITASPNVLWPPNHKMVDVTLAVSASDDIDAAPVSTITSVESSNGGPDDFVITGVLSLKLRAERPGTGDRVYTIHVRCIDASGNASTATVLVRVPHSR